MKLCKRWHVFGSLWIPIFALNYVVAAFIDPSIMIATRRTHQPKSKVLSLHPLAFINDAVVPETEATGVNLSNGSSTDTSVVSLLAAPKVKAGWMERFRQLKEFKDQYGHTLVPKRYKENPSLGNWVNKQRQQHRNFISGAKPCSLTESRIEMLNRIGFCWDATTTTISIVDFAQECAAVSPGKEEQWWQHFKLLKQFVQPECESGKPKDSTIGCLVYVPRTTKHGAWLDRQRKAYQGAQSTSNSTPTHRYQPLSNKQISALSSLDPHWWMTRRQWQWECRLRELHDYARRHGDCCVPISYAENKLLAHWVSNQRKQYNLRVNGLPSDLNNDRLQRLEAIGFVWNRWEHEFNKKESAWTSYR